MVRGKYLQRGLDHNEVNIKAGVCKIRKKESAKIYIYKYIQHCENLLFVYVECEYCRGAVWISEGEWGAIWALKFCLINFLSIIYSNSIN